MRRPSFLFAGLAAVLVLTATPSSAGPLRWTRSPARAVYDVAVAPDGGVYAALSTRRGVALARYAAGGRLLWTRRWNGPGSGSWQPVVDVAEDGTVVWGGNIFGDCEGGGWFLEWRAPDTRVLHRYVTPGYRCGLAEMIRDVAVTDGQVIVAGFSHGCCGDPYRDGWVRAFGMDGRFRWSTDIEPPGGTPADWYDQATGLAVGAFGNLYVAGWAATERLLPDGYGGFGTPIVAKLTNGGGVLWSRRLPARTFFEDTEVSVAARGTSVAVAASVGGGYLGTRGPAPGGWVGVVDTGGTLRWDRRWDVGAGRGAVTAGVAIDRAGRVRIVGTREAGSDRGLDAYVRTVSRAGRLLGMRRLPGPETMAGTGIAVRASGYFVSGFDGVEWQERNGRLWLFDG